MDNTLSIHTTSPPFAALANTGSNTFGKLETYLGLSRMNEQLKIDIPETLIAGEGIARPVFMRTSATGYIQTLTTNAVESFFRATISLHLTDSFHKPCAYKVPGYIFHTRTTTHIAFDPESARRLADGEKEYVLQRYIASGDFVPRKMRTVWTAHHHATTLLIEQSSPLPFNVPNIAKGVPVHRKMSFLAQVGPQERPRRKSQFLPTSLPLHPDLQVQTKEVSVEDEEWEQKYVVSFRQATTLPPKEVGLQDRAPNGDQIISAFRSLSQHSSLPELSLSTLTFDMVQTIDNRWVFLNIKKITYRDTGERGRAPAQRSLMDITASLTCELHKAPAIDMEEIQKQNILLYERLLHS